MKTATVKTPNGRVEVAEVRDPEEAKSFPLPASVHHRSASSPSVAGEAAVAPGAPSDAEVKRELNEMHAVERAAAQTQRRELTPVAGGESVGGNGTIPIPSGVPEVVQKVIAGGNAIADFPYIWGGGHASFIANGYDCSGSVSYALAAGGLLSAPLVSGELADLGRTGAGALDHDLRKRRAHVHGRRRRVVRHRRAQRAVRLALAGGDAAAGRLRRAPPAGLISSVSARG